MAEICLWTKAWRSGAAWVAQKLAQGIAEAGGTITFVAPLAEPATREPHHPRLRRIVLQRELLDGQGGRAMRVVASLRRMLGGASAVLQQRARTKTFVVTIPDPLVLTIPVFVILRLTGARIILIVHDVVPHAWRFGVRLRWLERGAHGLVYRLATSLVVLTPSLKTALVRDFAMPAGKIDVIPHGPFEIPEVAPLSGSGKFFQFGTIRRNKSVLDVIQGISLARRGDPAISLLIAGEPHPHELDYWAECLAAVAQDPTGFDLRIGFVPDDALPELIAGIDAFVLAYQHFDSQSGVGVLAALCGRPVLGTTSGGLSELFQHGMCGELIRLPISADSVAEAIATFRTRPAADWRERSAMAANQLRAVLSWTRIGQAYIDVARRSGRVS